MKKTFKTFVTLLVGGYVAVTYSNGAGTHYKGLSISNYKKALELNKGVVDYDEFYDEEFVIYPAREFDGFSYNNKSRIVREFKYFIYKLISWVIK